MRPEHKKRLSQLRRRRIRKKISGTAERPRMAVKFSNEHIYVQFIDDVKGVTIASSSTRSKTVENRDKLAANKASAAIIGKAAAEAAAAKGIKAVVFDRGGASFHWSEDKDKKPVYGKLATLAAAARAAGLKF